ncbi:threonine ammonia-lyase IlvA [Ruania halotolerans]|uniref:threonine ammonia-lyase IlvA n=1 Tax=Ruania halotolerans TaxID=2897773 RepID=UPI001E64E597|nr:threonine ammonia-lyase IlvA [Ruania halotolerans]UFU05590.1 threonine ammonia-lyase IlvA [Ruania halotolerans]
MPSEPVTATSVREAAQRIQHAVSRTPLQRWERMSAATGAQVLLKREDQQSVRSYKVRGAFNLMLRLDEQDRARGVVCASAGNHAQGVAKACHELGIAGRIFVPRTTPRQKLSRIAELGGDQVTLIPVGSTFDEASAAAREFAATDGAVQVHPFDDVRTIAGQGTVAKELHDQLGHPPDVVVVPVGGGGLIAGMGAYLAEACPQTRVVGVEPGGAASMAAALAAGEPVSLTDIDTFVDGAAVRRVGEVPFGVVSGLGLPMTAVPEGRLCAELLSVYQTEGIVAEPAGALTLAAVGPMGSGAAVEVHPGSTVVCVLSGGNNDISRYPEVEERALVYAGLRHYFVIDLPQEPGALRRFLDRVLGPEDDISLFEYTKRSNRETGPAFVGLTLGSADGYLPLLERMDASRLTYEAISPESPLFRFFT